MSFHEYPYTNFHEMNLDWVVKKVKELAAAWAQVQQDWTDEQAAFANLQSWIENYFNNLDVQTEINVKLDAMVAAGTMSELIAPYVASGLPAEVADQIGDVVASQIGPVVAAQIGAVVADQLPAIAASAAATEVGTWLSTHIDPDTGYVIDDSLTVQGAAADAKATGDEVTAIKSALTDISVYVVSPNLMNFEDSDFETGKYMATNGTKYNSSSYNLSGYIPVEEGETYIYCYGLPVGSPKAIRFLTAFDSSKTVVTASGVENVLSYTVPSGVAFIRISCDSEHFKTSQANLMVYKGPNIDKYYPYWVPYYIVKNDALDTNYLNSLIDAKISSCVTDFGISVKATANEMTSEDTLTVVERIDNKKNASIGFIGYFDSFTSVSIGHGYNKFYGNYCVIDNTNITVYSGTTPSQVAQAAHGLTISDFIQVLIVQGNNARAKIHIITSTGNYTLADTSWDGCNGDVFVKVGATMTDCVCNAIFRDFNENVFVFGDSYISLGDSARYPYYMIQQNYTHVLLDGYGGRNSANGLTSFNNVIAKAIPKYAVWALGMNDGDTSSAVNASWLSCVQSFLSTCEEHSIVPILATIPNCPSVRNTYKNAWVKSSGYRYVDFAKAVGAEEAGSTWYTGMLSNDNVHPSVLGAKALYARFISDVPESMKLS